MIGQYLDEVQLVHFFQFLYQDSFKYDPHIYAFISMGK